LEGVRERKRVTVKGAGVLGGLAQGETFNVPGVGRVRPRVCWKSLLRPGREEKGTLRKKAKLIWCVVEAAAESYRIYMTSMGSGQRTGKT